MKKETIEKIKEYGYKVSAKEDKKEIMIKLEKSNKKLNVVISKYAFTYYLHLEVDKYFDDYFDKEKSSDELDKIEKEMLMFVIKEEEKATKDVKKWFLIDEITTHHMSNVLRKNQYVNLSKQKKVIMEEIQKLTKREIAKRNAWMSFSAFETVKNYIEAYEEAVEVFKLYNEKEMLFLYQQYYQEHRLHIDGSNMTSEIKVNIEGIEVSIYDETKKIHTFQCLSKSGEFQKEFQLFLEKIKKQQKIKNIFEPSYFFLEKVLRKELSDDDVFDQGEKIKEKLLRMYLPSEIEEIAASYVKKQSLYVHSINRYVQFFYFGKMGILLDWNKGDVYGIEKTENIQEEILTILRKNLENEVKHALKDI